MLDRQSLEQCRAGRGEAHKGAPAVGRVGSSLHEAVGLSPRDELACGVEMQLEHLADRGDRRRARTVETSHGQEQLVLRRRQAGGACCVFGEPLEPAQGVSEPG